MLSAARLALVLGGWAQLGTQRVFGGLSGSHARGWCRKQHGVSRATRLATMLEGLCARRVCPGIRFVLNGKLEFLWGSYLFNHFSGTSSRKKRFSNFQANLPILTIKSNS
jgi:hypothetical protein